MTRGDIIDREWIASRIPHQGSMCLLDSVESWDEQGIVCLTRSHAQVDNPLRTGDTLGIANGIEYAAQAMAVHGALLLDEGEAPPAGYLTSVREVHWHRARFDDVKSPLRVCAQRLSGNGSNVLYSFAIYADDSLLLDGRASVVLNVADARPFSNSKENTTR